MDDDKDQKKLVTKFTLDIMPLFYSMLCVQVLEIRPRSVHQLPVGARVCTVWSAAYICLFPGTIVAPWPEHAEPLPDNHVLVELDDGDSRLVEVDKIRMLPPDYSRVGE